MPTFPLHITFWGGGLKDGFLCGALAFLELTLYTRLTSNSENYLPRVELQACAPLPNPLGEFSKQEQMPIQFASYRTVGH